MTKKITVKDLKSLKGKKQLTLILVKNKEEALAADQVGIEMMGTGAAGKFTNRGPFIPGDKSLAGGCGTGIHV